MYKIAFADWRKTHMQEIYKEEYFSEISRLLNVIGDEQLIDKTQSLTTNNNVAKSFPNLIHSLPT